ncbi:protein FAM200A-like [Protopterus annectens]|uniref:protein FAM200A-like n=1 Tax=Protopterus annectens TaxID=7888 RepID=UPI001CFB7BBA|nr:protein FAM200A-like [Protopterus annectens]
MAIEFFQRKRDELQKQKSRFIKCATINTSAVTASYKVALRIAKAKKPHTIAEELILPSAFDMVQAILGEKMAKQLRTIPLSNDTISRRIADMSADVNEQLVKMLKTSKIFAIQLDESTDVANCAMLMVYVRFVNVAEACVDEQFMFCNELSTRTTSEEIFKVLDKFITENGLNWDNCIGITTDGAAAMTGKKSGLVQRVKHMAPKAVSYHCFIHREALAAKELSEDLHNVLASGVKMVNFIKASALNTRLFEVLCSEMGSEHVHLLLHTEVRWLSRGRILQRLYELRSEVFQFLSSKNSPLAAHLVDTEWLAKLAYLVDVFGALNDLNLALQGRANDISRHADKINAFIQKLEHWRIRVAQGRMDAFSFLSEHLMNVEHKTDVIQAAIQTVVVGHLDLLRKKFLQYFPALPTENFKWVRNPFETDVTSLSLAAEMESQLIELSCDTTLKTKFDKLKLSDFWLHVGNEYPLISQEAMSFLLPFATTYLCETGFSAMTAMKTKYRNKLRVSDDLRLCLTTISPRISLLVSRMQSQPSH